MGYETYATRHADYLCFKFQVGREICTKFYKTVKMVVMSKTNLSIACYYLMSVAFINSFSAAFQVNSPLLASNANLLHSSRKENLPSLSLSSNRNADDEPRSVKYTPTCFNPKIRKTLTALSTAGMIETGYLSYLKLYTPSGISDLCSATGSGSCTSVLNSPYATLNLNGFEIPLTVIGCLAYGIVALLSFQPLIADAAENDDETNNRMAILGITTSMATFSSFLVSILFNVLHESCPFCIISATLSISMGFLAWYTGFLPYERRENGVKLGIGSFATTTIAALALFFSVDEAAMTAYQSGSDIMQANGLTSTVVASAAEQKEQKDIPPPPITATSTERTLLLAQELKSLDARMFGAYWCSHCYEQKQRLGKEAMSNVGYVECSKEGLNSAVEMCKERNVPGYPTWEIGGKLFPGEMYIDELENIVKDFKK